jgi:phage terminase large subunit GpA-like protein
VEYRVLSSDDSGAAGRWDQEARPYQNQIMDAMADSEHEFVSVIGPSQWGKTQISLNILGRIIHVDPGPTMVVHPTIGDGQKWSKTRFMPMIRQCPVLTGLAVKDRARNSSSTILTKTFRGMLLTIVGANAPGGLAAQPIKNLIFEEIGRVPIDKSAGKEGDYEALAIARTTDENFLRIRKIIRTTSPGIEGACRGERAFNESDQRYWFFKCPHCGHLQRLHWENVVLEPLTYACSGGGCAISDPELRKAVRFAEREGGGWIATRPEIRNHAGFWVHGLQVRSMAYIAAEFVRARKGGTQTMQAWKNTCLGILWSPRDGDAANVEGLQARARGENYISGQVPEGVGLLVASIDVQTENPQRLELLVLGVGAGEETWRITREIIPGNLATPEPWDRAEAFLNQEWPRVGGGTMRVRAAAVDIGGHFSKHVYAFCRRPGLKGRAYPIKGATQPQTKLVRRSRNRMRLWLIDGVTAKDDLFGRLKIEAHGPGHCHFPQDMDAEYFEQLFTEKPSHKGGRRTYEKVTQDARNEAIDLEQYAMGALAIFAPRDLEALVEKAQGSPAPPPTAGPEDSPAAAPAPAPEAPRSRVNRGTPRGFPGGGFGRPW